MPSIGDSSKRPRSLRAEVKDLSRQVGEARRAKADEVAESAAERPVARSASASGSRGRPATAVGAHLRAELLMIPNLAVARDSRRT